MKFFLIGTGLIGGSMSKDLRNILDNIQIHGIDKNEISIKHAKSIGVIDNIDSLGNLNSADRVILSVPVSESLKILPFVLDNLNKDALVWDVGSTKFSLCKSVETHSKRNQFLATHPIAGNEFSGPEASVENLFNGKIQILCEPNKTRPDLLQWAESIFSSMGMKIRYMNPEEHDKKMAIVSHLSHISSFMLGKTVMDSEENDQNILDFAGSGFESTVRLAKSSPEMWSSIFKDNRENILEILNAYIENLKQFQLKIENENYNDLKNQMIKTNKLKKILDTIKPKN
ncbi:MAG: prephenate dehydrogenase [Flavobacteriaceae bacterium]|tara:strand:+ start:3928 stop:4785 length:858 start_codon:yes stop_codon:yes gene_type:complete